MEQMVERSGLDMWSGRKLKGEEDSEVERSGEVVAE